MIKDLRLWVLIENRKSRFPHQQFYGPALLFIASSLRYSVFRFDTAMFNQEA